MNTNTPHISAANLPKTVLESIPVSFSTPLQGQSSCDTCSTPPNTMLSDSLSINYDSPKSMITVNSELSTKRTEDNLPLSLLESQWVTDDVIYAYSEIVNSKICTNNSGIFFLSPTVTIGIRILEDFECLLEPLLLEGGKWFFYQ